MGPRAHVTQNPKPKSHYRQEVLTSGTYRQGYAYAESQGDVPPGVYTAIVSTYEAGLTGAFVLNVRSLEAGPLQQATLLLPEGDGMVKHAFEGRWSVADGTAGGSRPPLYATNPIYSITCGERARVLMRLACTRAASEPINVAVFQAPKGGALPPSATYATAADVGTSHAGIYTACASGVATAPLELDAGATYLAVLACYDEGVEAGFELVVYSSSRNVTVTRVR